MKYSKYFLIIALFGIVTSCSDFLDRTNPNEPDNVTFWVNEDQLKNALPPCYEALQKDYLVNWSESTAETVMWGNITSGLSKVSGGKHSYTVTASPSLPIGQERIAIFIAAIIFWTTIIKRR